MNELNVLMEPEKFMEQIPKDISIKYSRNSKVGFAETLWNLLEWVEESEFRKMNMGIRWISDDEFLIDKKRFCSVTNTPLNTLNCKLRTFQFVQSQKRHDSFSFYKCDLFRQDSSPEDLQRIDFRKNLNEENQLIMPQAMFLPLLVDVRLHTTKPTEISYFKSDSINLWHEIVGRESLWSINRTEFINSAAELFSRPFIGYFDGPLPAALPSSIPSTNQAFTVEVDPLGGFNAQQTEFVQYISANGLDFASTARQMISYVIPAGNNDIVTLHDFCMFFARFGPDDFVLEKIHQLLCCSKSYNDWFQPGEQVFDASKPMSGSYSNTFANCFIIKRAQKLTYHIYNLINASTRSGFLIDETGKKFKTWHAVCECLNIPVQQPISYGGGYDQNEFAY